MNRSELIKNIQEMYPDLRYAEVRRIVNSIFEEITRTLCEGGRVELRGFGVFSVRERRAKEARNPRTGEAVHVERKSVPFFKPGKLIRRRLNSRN